MSKWLVSDPGDRCSAKLDIRDLGGHLDVTRRARAATLCSWRSGVLPRVLAVPALPLDFCGKLRLLKTMHVLAALHGAEASVVAQDGLRKLRTAFVRAVLSGALTLATPGAVPSLLEGLVGWTLAIMWSGSCVDIWPESRICMSHIYGLLGVVSAGTPRHVPFTVLFLVLPLSWASLAF